MKKLLLLITLLFIGSLAFSQISLTENHTAPTCYGYSDGTATITATGGTAPYSYTLFTTQNSTGIFTGLPPGIQTIVVEDAALLTATIALTIPVPPQIIPTLSSTPALCFGTATGTINVTNVSGGNPVYQYNLNGGAYQGLPSFTYNVFAGIYIVGVKDVNGCIGSNTVQVTEPTQLNMTVSSQNANCNAQNGIASTTVTGGTPIYTYTWSGGGAAAVLNNVTAGNYTVTATDANGCTVYSPVVVGLTGGGTATITASNNVTCNGLCNGSLTASMIGGTAPFTYSWIPSGQNSSTATGLCPGTYSCTITDFYGCTSTVVGIINQPSPLASITNANNVRCFGTSTGTISIAGAGGTAPYAYLWPSIPSTLAIVPNVPIGTYTSITTDANGCVIGNSVTVTEPTQLVATITTTNASCGGVCDGAFNVSASGGASAYTFSNGFGPISSNNINQCAGTQTIIITDANNCVFMNAVTITQSAPLIASVSSQTNVTCFGQCDGSVSTIVNGGTTPYMYSWSSGQVTPTVQNLCSGTYTFQVTDINGCSATSSVSITEPTQLTIYDIANLSCVGQATISAIGLGGTPGYSYNLNGSAYQSSGTFSNLLGGIYTVGVKDANGCIISNTIQVNQPAPLSFSITSQTNIACFGDCNGLVQLTASGGTTPYSYYTQNLIQQSNSTLNGLCAGTHTVYVEDANHCQYGMTTYITQPASNLTAVVSSTNATCGQNDGSLCATVSGGTSPYSSAWSTGSTSLCNNLIPAGLYTYTVTDSNGCFVTANKIISSIGGPIVSIASQTNVSCFGLSNGSASAIATGGTAPYTYTWTQTSTNSPTLSLVTSGIYNVVVADVAGCVGTQSVVITQPSQLLIYTYAQPECGGGMCNGSINANVNGGTAPYAYTWSTGATTANYLPGLCAGMYSVQVTDMMGCVATQTAFVNQTLPITITPSYTNESCGGSCDGTASMTVMGGTPGYVYYWTPNTAYGSNVSNLCPGTYTFVVTDGLGCSGTNVFTISNSGLSSISNATLSTLPIKETCLNSADGNIDLTITGTNPGPLQNRYRQQLFSLLQQGV